MRHSARAAAITWMAAYWQVSRFRDGRGKKFSMSGPLSGVIVADFTQLMQGPFATQILGDLGADIIKIEPPKGDWARHFSLLELYKNGESVSFMTFNRNKRSIAIDLKQQDGS